MSVVNPHTWTEYLWTVFVAAAVLVFVWQFIVQYMRKRNQGTASGARGRGGGRDGAVAEDDSTHHNGGGNALARTHLRRKSHASEEEVSKFVQVAATEANAFKKFGRRGSPHKRRVRWNPDSRELQWWQDRGGEPTPNKIKKMPINRVERVEPGARSNVFKKNKSKVKDASLCLSIYWPERTLDLELESEEQRNIWVQGLLALSEGRDQLSSAADDGHQVAGTTSTTESGGSALNDENTEDSKCLEAVDLFFNNKISEAEAFCQPFVNKYPRFALFYATMSFLQAMMTWEKDVVEQAQQRLQDCIKLLSTMVPASDGWFGGGDEGMTTSELEASIITAECQLFLAVLCFTGESYMAMVKAGFAMKSANKAFQKCEAEIKAQKAKGNDVDPCIEAGIWFGPGMFNAFTSVLPPFVMKILEKLGFPTDAEHGLQLLQQCSQHRGVRSAMASIVLLSMHVVLPANATTRAEYHRGVATKIFERVFKLWPHSAIFWQQKGTFERFNRNLEGAVEAFTKSSNGKKDWKALQSMNGYELAFTYLHLCRWKEAGELFASTGKDNTWSKGTFIFLEAVCRHESGDDAGAKQLMSTVQGACARKPIMIEMYCIRLANGYLKDPAQRDAYLVLAGPVLSYFHDGFWTLSDRELKEGFGRTQAVLDGNQGAVATPRGQAICLFMKACYLKYGAQVEEAEQIFLDLAGRKPKDVGDETWTIPFAKFELAHLTLSRAIQAARVTQKELTTPRLSKSDITAIDKLLVACKEYKGEFDFKPRFGFRTHLITQEFKKLQEKGCVY